MTDRLELPLRHRRELKALLHEHVPEAEVWAYGSRVSGESHPASDLDLVLRGPNLEPLGHGFSDLLEALEDSNIPILIQAHDWARLPEIFHREIERHYVVVQEGAKPTAAGEWRTVAFGEVIEFVIGGGWGQETRFPESAKVSVIRGTDFKRILDGDYENVPTRYEKTSTVERRELKPGDVILEISGGSRTSNQSTGRSFLVTTKHLNQLGNRTIPASFCRLLRFDKGQVDSGYAYYSLQEMYRSGRAELYEQQSTGISNFQFAYFVDSEVINLPPLPEQRAIAHVLGTLDDKIELNRRMNETLEETARALFKSWFVDFDPVRAKMEGRDTGLPPDIADLFPDRFVPSELGEIPEGWEVETLGDCVDVTRGLSYKGALLSSCGLPMHNLNSIYEGGGYKDEGIKYYKGDYRSKHAIRTGDVLVANTEQGHDRLLIGYAAIAPTRFGDTGLFSHHLYKVQLKSSNALTSEYICQVLNSPAMHDVVSGFATGTTVNMLPVDALKIPTMVMPPPRLIATHSAAAEAMRNKQERLLADSQVLAAQRDALLPKVMSGEVRVAR